MDNSGRIVEMLRGMGLGVAFSLERSLGCGVAFGGDVMTRDEAKGLVEMLHDESWVCVCVTSSKGTVAFLHERGISHVMTVGEGDKSSVLFVTTSDDQFLVLSIDDVRVMT